MSLVTVLRSPSTSESTSLGDSEVDEDQEDSSFNRSRASSFEGFFASKGAAFALPDGDFARRASKHGGEMQLHLQAMVNLLRDEDVLRLVVKLECQYSHRIRYLTIVSAFGPDEEEQSIVMGVDWTDKATIGLVVPLYRDTNITLDGDGGFKMMSAGRGNIFKPISVQTMWTALQWIHKCADNARRKNYFYPNGSSHAWVDYYYRKISSDRLCLNEWHQMEDIESKRPESPIGTSTEKELVTKLIRHKLREVMMKVDLEEVTSRQVRTMLEEDTQMDFREYRSFIDEEMFTILGQMDSASKIFDHVYLGSEWNASNLEELKENGVGYILNITREIDNFFPGTFHYHNIRVYDVDETELLHHWDNTYKFIQKAKNSGSNVLVHCRMGISRSASTVIAYGMKEYGWSLGETMKYVKSRRGVVQPNAGFWKQLITYEGILNSSKQRYNKLFTNEAEREAAPIRKTKTSGNTTVKNENQPQPDGVDTVDSLPREHVSDLKIEETSEEENKDSAGLLLAVEENLEVVQGTAEDHDDVFISEDDVRKMRDDHSVLTSLSSQNLPVELTNETVEENDVIKLNSCVSDSPAAEKTALYRVKSVPMLLRDDKAKHKSNVQRTNFQRSSSLRERGPKKIQHLRDFMEGKAASDENITECSRNEKGTFESLPAKENSRLNESLEDHRCGAGSNSQGSLPRELHGLLESGFVKRKSRNFEEGVHNVLSTEQDDMVGPEKEVDMEYELGESDKPTAAEKEQGQDESSEEPEPGVVKKHKEEYELKHRESLKRGAVLQRGESCDGSSLKRERSDGTETVDAGLKSLGDDGSEKERPYAVKIDAVVRKVNEDMRKEVSARRISKKEQELRALVQLAGKGGTLNQENEDSVADLSDSETTEVPAVVLVEQTNVKGRERLVDDPWISKKAVDCTEMESLKTDLTSDILPGTGTEQAVSADIDSSANILTECKCGSAEKTEEVLSEQDKERTPHKGLVKRHTLLIEGKLQPWEQETGREVQSETDNESKSTEQHKMILRSPSKEQTVSVEGIEAVIACDVSAESVTKSTEREAPELSTEGEDRTCEEDTQIIPQKGLVKRHTLLIEGRLQPLEQALAETENESSQEDELRDNKENCKVSSKEKAEVVAVNRIDPVDGENVKNAGKIMEKGKVAPEKMETCDLLEDTKDRMSEHDFPQKGIVKRQTLVIEGKLMPIEQEQEELFAVEQELYPSPSKVEIRSSEQLQSSVAEDVNVEDNSTTEGVERAVKQDQSDEGSDEDKEQLSQTGLVKRHTLIIEGKLQSIVPNVESENNKQDGPTNYEDTCLSSSVDEEQTYQLERTGFASAAVAVEKTEDSETVSGLVRREKERIEKRATPLTVDETEIVQEEEKELLSNDGTMVSEEEDESSGDAEENDGMEDDRVEEKQLSDVGVDRSSVVRVKDHTEHLEGVIRVTTTTKDGAEKIKQPKEDLPETRDEPPKVIIVPRSCSDVTLYEKNQLTMSCNIVEKKMEEILSDSTVDMALVKAQEKLEFENKTFIDWDDANVKQRTEIFERIMQHTSTQGKEDESNRGNHIRRCGSMPKTIRTAEKYVLRRRSFSDTSETVSSSSGREVGYTIEFSNGQSSSSSSLPREWSPFQKRLADEVWDVLKTSEVFSPQIYSDSESKERMCIELIDRQDQENNSLSVQEKVQVLDSKNHRNISNVS